jgi:superfamily II DNA or RNA helicase
MAGALQAVYADMPNRNYTPDVQQELAIEAAGESLMGGRRKGYFEMATGTGKTLVEVALAEAAVRAGQRALILAPTLQIADQIYGENGETGFGRFTDLLPQGIVGRSYGGRHANKKTLINIGTYPGLVKEVENPKWGEYGILLGDECHRSLGEKTSWAMTNYMPGANRYGFSATPDFAEDRKSDEVYGERLFEFALRTAIESGKTAPVRALLYETGQTLNLTDSQRDFTEAELAPLIEQMDRNGIAVKMTRDFIADGRQGIIPCVSGQDNAHARLMAHILSNTEVEVNGHKRNIVAVDIGSHLTRDEQKRRLQDYKDGKIDVLTFTKTLEEGWDSDRASFCINLSPTTSPVRIKQLLGRIIRRKKNGKESIFVDFVDEKSGIAKQQYTAMHALEIEEIDVHRVLGKSSGSNSAGPNPEKNLRDISQIFDPTLYARLLRGQGKLLQDVLITALKNPVDPLVAEWERTLGREKPPMVGELPYNPIVSVTVARSLGAIARKLRKETGLEPTTREILAASPIGIHLLRNYGIRTPWNVAETDIAAMPQPTVETDSPLDPAAYIDFLALRGHTAKALGTLSEREADVVRLIYDLNGDGQKRTLDEIGAVYGVTRERIRQIWSKAMSNLRHPMRSSDLRPFLYEYEDAQPYDPDPKPVAWTPEKTDVFDDITVPVFDAKDDRPYNVRLQSACEQWLAEKRASDSTSATYSMLMRRAAGDMRPDFMQIHGEAIGTAEQGIEYYEAALARLGTVFNVVKQAGYRFGPYSPNSQTGHLVNANIITIKDLEVIFNIAPNPDPSHLDVLFSYGPNDLTAATLRAHKTYEAQIASLRGDRRALWKINDGGALRGYDKDRLRQAAAIIDQNELASERRELLKIREKIVNRPYPGGSSAAKEASLLVINTKLRYIENRPAETAQGVQAYMDSIDAASPYVLL